jgi:hypothetical protein
MKLNMMVVMTVWLPRQACSAPGTAPHAAEGRRASTISGSISQAGSQPSSASAARPAPSPPMMAWPSPPMLNSPPWKASATARPVKTKVVA